MLHLVLYQPEIPQNTGNIIRTCACLGARLHLIHPLGFSLEEKQLRRAGLDYRDLAQIEQHLSFAEFAQGVEPTQIFYFTTKTSRIYNQVPLPQEAYLVFGPESRGLPAKLLAQQSEQTLTLPMRKSPGIRSLNLSNAVAIAAYEWVRQYPQTL